MIGIKVATLDSVMTFQRIAALVRGTPGKLLITGEDRFLGYSILMGARAALVGMGAALTDLQCALLRSSRRRATTSGSIGCWARWISSRRPRSCRRWRDTCDACCGPRLPTGLLPADACDDPWAPPESPGERDAVIRAVHDARAAGR